VIDREGSVRNWLLFFHVLGAMAWLGGSIYVQALMAGAVRTRDPRTIMRTSIRVVDANARVFTVAPLLTLGFGLWLVIDGAGITGFEEFWVTASFLLTLGAIAAGMMFLQPKGRRLLALVDERGMEDPETAALARSIGMGGRLATGVIFVVFILMIFKPTL
jgi:uncharacterized membrane protein